MQGKDERSPGPLTCIRVIELADEQAEYCGLTLAGLGADVIKVEPPGGNPTRRIGPLYEDREDRERSLFFWQYNRGARRRAPEPGDALGRARPAAAGRPGSSPFARGRGGCAAGVDAAR